MNTADSNPDNHHQTLQTGTHRKLVNDDFTCYCMRPPCNLAYAHADGCLTCVD